MMDIEYGHWYRHPDGRRERTLTFTVMLLTYRRTDYALRTLAAFDRHWAGPPIDLIIADDGSDSGHRQQLWRFANSDMVNVEQLAMINVRRRGYGAAYNIATGMAHTASDYVIPLEDDWECLREFDPERYLQFVPPALSVRLGYIGWTQPLRGHFIQGDRGAHGLLLDPESPEPHVFSGHPRIDTVEYQRAVGLWPEEWAPGDVEFHIANRPAARSGVVWPLELSAWPLFGHIGTIQARDDQAEGATV